MINNKDVTLEDIRDGYNKLFYSTQGKVGYRIIAAEFDKLIDDIIKSVEKDVNYKKQPTGLVGQLANKKEDNFTL